MIRKTRLRMKMEEAKKVRIKDALQIIYYLMAVDGEICQAEEKKFDAIGEALDSNFKEKKKEILEKCSEQLNKVIDGEEYYDVIREGVEGCFQFEDYGFFEEKIDSRLLVWDLLTIAFSDGKYIEEERKLIKMVTRKLDLDKVLFLEMENSIKTIFALDREEIWLKETNRPYSSIEPLIKEIANRRDIITQSVKELIED